MKRTENNSSEGVVVTIGIEEHIYPNLTEKKIARLDELVDIVCNKICKGVLVQR